MEIRNAFFPSIVFPPGDTLDEKLQEMGMSYREFAFRIGKSEATIVSIIGGTVAITAALAVDFENVTKIPTHFWLNHQRSYDEYIASN